MPDIADEPVVTGDGSLTLRSLRYGESYRSTNGAVTEAQHVFLQASGVSRRLGEEKATRVLEIGFGLGLNALLTADAAKSGDASLEYVSVEHDLVDAAQIERLNYDSILENPSLADSLVTSVRQCNMRLNDRIAGSELSPELRHVCQLACSIKLELILADALDLDLPAIAVPAFHAIYLDAFSPETNAECWRPDFIARLADVLTGAGKLVTYSAKGEVRRAMLAAGLHVEKRPGPPGKREMLVGCRES